MNNFFQKKTTPIIMAPLAGITDYPFRLVLCKHGADFCYEEMISACALLYDNRKTLHMVESNFNTPDFCKITEEAVDFRNKLGVQVVGKNDTNISQALKILTHYPFSMADINMGCPVPKVTKSGSGSAMLKDLDMVDKTLQASRSVVNIPLSIKVRLGWDPSSIVACKVAKLSEKHKIDFMYVHGRTRSQNYSHPVNLDEIYKVVSSVTIPVIANGNIFSISDMNYVLQNTGARGVLIGRAALGNPWIFEGLKSQRNTVSIDEWADTVRLHLKLQESFYQNTKTASILMRKHLIWYIKGWDNAKIYKDKFNHIESIDEGMRLVDEFYQKTPKDATRPVFLLNFDPNRYSCQSKIPTD